MHVDNLYSARCERNDEDEQANKEVDVGIVAAEGVYALQRSLASVSLVSLSYFLHSLLFFCIFSVLVLSKHVEQLVPCLHLANDVSRFVHAQCIVDHRNERGIGDHYRNQTRYVWRAKGVLFFDARKIVKST